MDIFLVFQILALLTGAYAQSYSQVRYASTRRNGTAYDAYSILSNPALANHRLPIYPQQEEQNPHTTTQPPLPPPILSPKPSSVIDVQSAIQDAMHQGNFHQIPFFGVNHLVPQYTDTLNPEDLQHASSHLHQVVVPPKTTTQSNEEERIRDYFSQTEVPQSYHHQTEVPPTAPTAFPEPSTTTDCLACRLFHEEFMKNQENIKVMTNKQTPAPQNSLPEAVTKVRVATTPKPLDKTQNPVDKTNFSAPATNELFSINDALVHQQKQPIQFVVPQNVPANVLSQSDLLGRPQTVINRLPNGFVLQPPAFQQPQPNIGALPQLPPGAPPGAILIDPNRIAKPQLVPGHPQGQNPVYNAGHPQGQNPVFNAGHPQGQNPVFNAGHPQGQNPVFNAGHPQGQNPVFNAGHPQRQKPMFNAGHPQGQNPLLNAGHPQVGNHFGSNGQQSANVLVNSGMTLPQVPQEGNTGFTAGPLAFPFDMQQGPQTAHPNAFNPLNPQNVQVEPNRRVNSISSDQPMGSPQQTPPGHVHGPMGIPIPIPPNSVPAHTVMGPPMAMPPMQIGNGVPTRKNGGFLDNIKNFFSSGLFNSNGQRARFLDDDNGILVDDNSTAIDELLNSNMTSSNETLQVEPEDNTEVVAEKTPRSKREVEENGTEMAEQSKNETEIFEESKNKTKTSGQSKNGTKTLLDEIGAYVRKTIHRLRDETERITTPLWPVIRDTVRTYFGTSKSGSATTRKPQITEDLERRSTKGKGLFTLLFENMKKENNAEDGLQDFLKSEEVTEQPIRQLKLAAATSLMPRCALETQNKNYCLQDSDYPTNLLKEAIQQDGVGVACNATLGRSLIHKLNTAKPDVCLSPIHKVMPLRAKNQDGVWKLIVNVDTCQQIIHIQKCHPSCATRTATSSVRAHCKEVHAPYTLFAFDSKYGFHLDKFQFPSACWCGS